MDPWTHLPGAEEFAQLIAREELRRARTGEPMTVAVLAVDGLRAVRAHHGAGAGSEALRRCADTLRASVRAVDEIARTGPEEFSVLLHATDASRASIWAERFEDAFAAAGESYIGAPLTCSLGVVDTEEEPTLMQATTRAHRRMTVIRTVRKLRRAHEGD